ncbi:MAG: DoxX family protein [Bacteroidales bacterium]|nr:DoxX family protein [Bacteroidales bacterium]
MKKQTNSMPWISILVALASAVGIYFLPAFQYWFLAILLLNLLVSLVFSKRYSPAALTICRLLVGALFIFSSFTKGVDPLGTKYKMLDYLAVYGMTWLNDAALVLAMLMILAEFIVGICLLTKVFPRLAVLGATLLMLFFTMTTLFDALYDLVPDCGCFGTAIKMSNWQTFYKNLVIDAVLIPLIMNNKQLKNKLENGVQFVIASAYALAFLGFEIYNYRHLPVVDFMNWKVGKQLTAETAEDSKVYLTYRNKVTGETKEYLSPNYPWNDSVWMSQWEFVDQRVEGGTNFLGFSALDEDGNDITESILTTENLLMFTSHDLSKLTDKDWEKAREVTATAEEHGLTVIWVVSEEPNYVKHLQEQHDFMYEVYYADELEIKPIVRSNPGLIWLDNGLVKDKWSAVDFSKALKAL